MEDETSGELLEMESAHTNEITYLSEFSGHKSQPKNQCYPFSRNPTFLVVQSVTGNLQTQVNWRSMKESTLVRNHSVVPSVKRSSDILSI